MSIVVADNFQYKGGKPLDARMKFATILDMTAAQVADLYDGCFSYVVAEKKYYSYDSNNENDPHLGKWREYSSGGAEYSDFTGATSQDAGAHGLVPAPTTADVDKYLKGDGSWGAISMPNFDYSNEFGAENIYDTQEKMIGQWTDGKPLYQKVVVFENTIYVTTSWTNLGFYIPNLEKIVYGAGCRESGEYAFYPLNMDYDAVGHQIQAMACRSDNRNTIKYLILRYTKTTDSAMSIGTPNDYSTTEKIVGTWIDGKPLWQKTVELPSRVAIKNDWTTVVYTDATIDRLVDVVVLDFESASADTVCNGVTSHKDSSGNIKLYYINSVSFNVTHITIRYTKTS